MKRILIVEDNSVNLELARQLLEDDYQLLTADGGQQGVATAIREVPDLILMDLSMPGMDGWTAASLLRLNPRTRHVPIAAVTANGAREQVMAAGFDAYVSKPIEESILLATVRELLERTSAPGSLPTRRA